MQTHVTVIPSDKIILVNGEALVFEFPAPANMHALQWHDGEGHIEFTDDLNHPLTEQDYQDDVQPFVELWEAEKAKWEDEANRPLSARLQELDIRLHAIDMESIRPLRALADNTATEADRKKLAELEKEAELLRNERVDLAP